MSRKAWLQHFLRIKEDLESVDNAFTKYLHFIQQEQQRTFDQDTHFRQLLQALPMLKSLTLSHINKWSWKPFRSPHYNKLVRRISTLPHWESVVSQPLLSILSLLNTFPKIRRLNIYGSLSPTLTKRRHPQILHLEVTSIVSYHKNSSNIKSFLSSFPNLRTVLISMEGGGRGLQR